MPGEKKIDRNKPITAERYSLYVEHLRLESVRLVALEASLTSWPKTDDPLRFTIEFSSDLQDGEGEVVFGVTYKMAIFEGQDSKAEIAHIKADYAVICSAPETPPKGFLDMFGPMNLSRLVYPFFREQVAGITAKMELPTLFVPLNIFGGNRSKKKRENSD